MGLLLKEALKTLCGVNRWSYAVFWRIGCQNPKLLIWEECYYESMLYSGPPHFCGFESSEVPTGDWDTSWVPMESRSSQLGIQPGDRVHTLINNMMISNQVNIVGEGIVGRAAFTGKYQWIVSNTYSRDDHPSEVLKEVHHQFSAGMQTVAVIPVLHHGVLQFGSPLLIQEDMGFVSDVKSLILELGCSPGALLYENFATKGSTEKVGIPVSGGMPVSVNLYGIYKVENSTQPATDNCQRSHISEASGLGRLSHSLIRQIPVNPWTSDSTFRNLNPMQTSSKSLEDCCQPTVTSVVKLNLPLRCQLENRDTGAEMMPSNPDAWPDQKASSCNSRSLRLKEPEIASDAGVQGHCNNNMRATSSSITSQLITNGNIVRTPHKDFISTPLLEGSEKLMAVDVHFKPSSFAFDLSSLHSSADIKHCFALLDGTGLRNAGLSKEAHRFSNLEHQLSTNSMVSGVSVNTHHSTDKKCTPPELGPREKMVENDLCQDFSIPLAHHLDGHTFLSDNNPGFINNCQKHAIRSQIPGSTIAKYEEAYGKLTSGDDLSDILGVDLKNKLLNGNWNNFCTNDFNPGNQNHVKDTSAFPNVQDEGSDFNSVSERVSGSGIYCRMGSDNLLDDVVFRAHSAAKQTLDDNVSCRTTMTNNSGSSIPSSCPTYGQINMSDYIEKESFGLSKPLLRVGAIGSSSVRSACSTDDPGNSCQSTSIYGSQLSSWIDQGQNVKCDSSGSTAYSKKPDEINKSSRKRLKPGEYPRRRPKDRQMIQDRVKELREIIPNGAKCSIDALLERTIKHMLFLQSVTQHADKLKQTGESKIINKEGGLILKDYFDGAFKVGSNSMVCPIVVEDLNQPRQMLVEMLCEEHGFFLEIADLIRGLGLTILNGVMEAKDEKIWARFAVEANRDVSRMEIFMSLVCLMEQSAKGSSSSTNAIDNNMMIHHSFPQVTSIPSSTSRLSRLQ